MDKRYTQRENIVFLVIPSEQQEWQQDVVEDLLEHKKHWLTLPERVERWRMERQLDEMYAGVHGE